MIRRLLPFLKPRWATATGGVVILLVGSVIEALQPWPIKWLIDSVLGDQPFPQWLARLWPFFASEGTRAGIVGVALAVVVLAVARQATVVTSQMLFIRAGWRIVLDLRASVMDHLHRLSLTYHDRTRVGESLYRVAYDTQAAQTVVSQGLVPIVTGLAVTVIILTVMWRMDPVMTGVALAVVPSFWLTIQGFGRRIERRAQAYHAQESALVATVTESLSSMRAVQAFTLEPRIGERFKAQAWRSVIENEGLSLLQLLFAAVVGVIMAVGTGLIVWVGAGRVLDGTLLIGDILVFLAYLGMLYQPMSAFSNSSGVLRSAGAQMARVFELLDTAPEVVDSPDARTLPVVQGRIQLRDVAFAYERGDPVLRGITLEIEPGEVVALVGSTGAGKTTLAGLILRFYDPTEGTVRLDGTDLRQLRIEWLRHQVAVVLQDPLIFSGSVRENIAYGRPDATDEEIEEAARCAAAAGFITDLPGGYDTQVGERGVMLSGGQKQRLAIARAFLKDAPVLVLDEPTSALDTITEAQLLESMRSLMKGRTTLIIAHRLSTVRDSDRIVVLDEGRVIEQGAHAELLERDSAYRLLYEVQSGEGLHSRPS